MADISKESSPADAAVGSENLENDSTGEEHVESRGKTTSASGTSGKKKDKTLGQRSETTFTAEPECIPGPDCRAKMGEERSQETGFDASNGGQNARPTQSIYGMTTSPPAATATDKATDLVDSRDDTSGRDGDISNNIDDRIDQILESPRPDLFLLRQLCHHRPGSRVPPKRRAEVWQTMLGVRKEDRFHLDQSISEVEGDLDNQRVIQIDAERTRATNARFRNEEMKNAIVRLLTFYCKRRGVRYKQGLNEVLAPFLLLSPDGESSNHARLPDGVIFNMFYAMISKFLPNVYSDDDFHSLQCSFRLFRFLLLYHDPLLCHRLDQYNMPPELYATPWFLTLFARNLEPELLFHLWDLYLIEDDPFLHHFVAYAFLASHRKAIMQAEEASLPETLARLRFRSISHVDQVVQEARRVFYLTPRSFRQNLYAVCYCPVTSATAPILKSLITASCLSVSASELVSYFVATAGVNKPAEAQVSEAEIHKNKVVTKNEKSGSPSNADRESDTEPQIQYFVLDCRSAEKFHDCHLAMSFHLDPALLSQPEELEDVIEGFRHLSNRHFCLVGEGRRYELPRGHRSSASSSSLSSSISSASSALSFSSPLSSTLSPSMLSPGLDEDFQDSQVGRQEDPAVTRMALLLLQKEFRFVSKVVGGYDAVQRALSMAGDQVMQPLQVRGSLSQEWEMLAAVDPRTGIEHSHKTSRSSQNGIGSTEDDPHAHKHGGEGSGGGRGKGDGVLRDDNRMQTPRSVKPLLQSGTGTVTQGQDESLGSRARQSASEGLLNLFAGAKSLMRARSSEQMMAGSARGPAGQREGTGKASPTNLTSSSWRTEDFSSKNIDAAIGTTSEHLSSAQSSLLHLCASDLKSVTLPAGPLGLLLTDHSMYLIQRLAEDNNVVTCSSSTVDSELHPRAGNEAEEGMKPDENSNKKQKDRSTVDRSGKQVELTGVHNANENAAEVNTLKDGSTPKSTNVSACKQKATAPFEGKRKGSTPGSLARQLYTSKLYSVVVEEVVAGSAAARSGCVGRGDLIVEANGKDLAGLSFQETMSAMRALPRPLSLRLLPACAPESSVGLDWSVLTIAPDAPVLVQPAPSGLSLLWHIPKGTDHSQLEVRRCSASVSSSWCLISSLFKEIRSTHPSTVCGSVTGLQTAFCYQFRVRAGVRLVSRAHGDDGKEAVEREVLHEGQDSKPYAGNTNFGGERVENDIYELQADGENRESRGAAHNNEDKRVETRQDMDSKNESNEEVIDKEDKVKLKEVLIPGSQDKESNRISRDEILWGPFSAPSPVMRCLATEEPGTAPRRVSSGFRDSPTSSPGPWRSSLENVAGNHSAREVWSSALSFRVDCDEVERSERGRFFYRVVIPVAVRDAPLMAARRIGGLRERGMIIKAKERLLKRGSAQVFVRLDWKEGGGNARQEPRDSHNAADEERTVEEGWVFENTEDGAVVLERVEDEPSIGLLTRATHLASLRSGRGQARRGATEERGEPPHSAEGASSFVQYLRTSFAGTTASHPHRSAATPPLPDRLNVTLPVKLAQKLAISAPVLHLCSASSATLTWVGPLDPAVAAWVSHYHLQVAQVPRGVFEGSTAAGGADASGVDPPGAKLAEVGANDSQSKSGAGAWLSAAPAQTAAAERLAWMDVARRAPADSRAYTIEGLQTNRRYVARIRAGTERGYGPFSNHSVPLLMTDPSSEGSPAGQEAARLFFGPDLSTFSPGSFLSRAASSASSSAAAAVGGLFRTQSGFLTDAAAEQSKPLRSKTRKDEEEPKSPRGNKEDDRQSPLPGDSEEEVEKVNLALWRSESKPQSATAAGSMTGKAGEEVTREPNAADRSQTMRKDDDMAFFEARHIEAPASSSTSSSVSSASSTSVLRKKTTRMTIVVTPGYFLAMEELDAEPGWALVRERRHLSTLYKISSRKTVKNMAIFQFKRNDGEVDILPYVINDMRSCIEIITNNYKKLTSGLQSGCGEHS